MEQVDEILDVYFGGRELPYEWEIEQAKPYIDPGRLRKNPGRVNRAPRTRRHVVEQELLAKFTLGDPEEEGEE